MKQQQENIKEPVYTCCHQFLDKRMACSLSLSLESRRRSSQEHRPRNDHQPYGRGNPMMNNKVYRKEFRRIVF